MGKFQRYFSTEPSSTVPGETKPPNSEDAIVNTEKNPNVEIETIVASKRPRKWINRKKGKFGGKKNTGDEDPFPKKAPLGKHLVKRYSRGQGLTKAVRGNIQTAVREKKIIKKDKQVSSGLEQAARAELLLSEQNGGIEVEDWEHTLQLKQCDIVNHVDITSATKKFELRLDKFGPYHMDYSLNGRQLLLGGRKGHIAALDWVTKSLLCEVNVTESVHDVKWLHNETLFAVAQKGWTYIYDNEGIEVHCLKKLDRVYSMDFLPYHFLLVAGHESGFLSWVDVSIGKIVAQYKSRAGPVPNILTTNQANAVTMCGHSNGTVTMWAPSVKDPLATMLCHGSPLSAVGVDTVGRIMATGSYDGTLRLWDLRNNYVPLTTCKVGIPTALNFSQRGMLAMSTANQSLVFSEIGTRQKPYLKHVSHSNVSSLKFCPFEDVLGIGSHDGFQSILVPGAGEANYDALERNPFQSKGQRKEAEVKALLDKIQPELITLDNSLLGEVDTVAIEDELQAKPKYVKKAEIELSHRKKRKNAKLPKIKAGLQAELNIKQAKSAYQQSKQEQEEGQLPLIPQVFSNPLDRFKSKKKRN